MKKLKLKKYFKKDYILIGIVFILMLAVSYLLGNRNVTIQDKTISKISPTVIPTIIPTSTILLTPTSVPVQANTPSSRALKVASEVVTYNAEYKKYFLDKYGTDDVSVAITKLAEVLDNNPAKLAGVETTIEQAINNRSRAVPQPVLIIP